MAKTLDAAGVKRLIQEIKGANNNLNAPIPISTENTPESMAQNVKNIADYVEKAKAAGIEDVNGMAVTCLIDDDCSGVGYLYSYNGAPIWVIGIITYDDSVVSPTVFIVDDEGFCGEREVVMKDLLGQVTSDMLVEGARKPIILTPSTTEVDEETYQKLLSDDVDVMFYDDGWYIPITIKNITDPDAITLDFSLTAFDGSAPDTFDFVVKDVQINITKNSPHNVTFPYNASSDLDTILQTSGYLNKSILSPVLQEIDLRGTDADRKAKLDQFETDWKALNGASDLTGARFVGHISTPSGNSSMIFTWNDAFPCYTGIGFDDTHKDYNCMVQSDGSLTITPLFSHLEAVPIKTSNSAVDKVLNIHALQSYIDNLAGLGVTDTLGIEIPICINNTDNYGILVGDDHTRRFKGFAYYDNIPVAISISTDGTVTISNLQTQVDNTLNTESKNITGAINEVNTLVEKKADKSLNAKSLEAIIIKTGNTPESMAANIAAIKAYVDNLIALGVDVTKGYMIPVKLTNGYHGFIMGTDADGGHTGIIKRNTYNYGGGWIFIDNIGSYQYLECLTLGSYDNLTTTAKTIVPAINEVNALAKGYSTIFTPIELTTETAQNKTAIDARVAAFTAQGISLTNGCCIPVTYKGVYAGNISLINGDWYGLLVKNTNNPADNINIKLSADGTITEGNSAQ